MTILHHDKLAYIDGGISRVMSHIKTRNQVLLLSETAALRTFLEDLAEIDKLSLVNIL